MVRELKAVMWIGHVYKLRFRFQARSFVQADLEFSVQLLGGLLQWVG